MTRDERNAADGRFGTGSTYVILELTRQASEEDIRRAHRRLAARYHPDVSREPDPDKFRERTHMRRKENGSSFRSRP
ncbi:MAG: DnaJ domain-containing protein [bacterium]